MVDYNFCFPVRELSNDRIKLVPFSVPPSPAPKEKENIQNLIQPQASAHAPEFFALSSPHPSLYAHIPRGPYTSLDDFRTNFIDSTVEPDPAWQLYAIIDKTKPTSHPTDDASGALAGVIGYLSSSKAHLSAEIGFLITLPAFQRTHVTSNAVGLLLQYALDAPED
ncbi:MAG: hypothetical protein Q9170_005439, partial [Blastenia crenularia]